MIKFISILVIGLLSSVLVGQSDTITNVKGSDYRFEKVYHLDATPVLSQGYTGTCWSFSGMSFFESELIRMGHSEIALSEMFMVRNAYQLKAEKYIRLNGNANFSQGGLMHDIPYLISQCGIVPTFVYDGLEEDVTRHDHEELFTVLEGTVKAILNHQMNGSGNKSTETWKAALEGVLDAYLGEEVDKFEYEGKEFTPQTFAKKLGLEIDNYCSLTSFKMYPWYKKCILEIPDNWSWGESVNVHLDDLVNTTIDALKNGYTIGWDADVSEDGFSFKNGMAINPVDAKDLTKSGDDKNAFMSPTEEVEVSDEARQLAFDNKTTTDDHLMHIIGLYKDQNGKNYFLVKNSWGTGNFPEGFLYVSESYFRAKTITIYLHKNGIPKDLTKKF